MRTAPNRCIAPRCAQRTPRRPSLQGDPLCVRHSRSLPPLVRKELAAANQARTVASAGTEVEQRLAEDRWKTALRKAVGAWNRSTEAAKLERPTNEITFGQGHPLPEGFVVGPRKDGWS